MSFESDMSADNSGQASSAQYPIIERAGMVDGEVIERYLDVLFGRLRYKQHHFINLRGIGEKGTDRDGVFRDDYMAQPGVTVPGVTAEQSLLADAIRCCTGWAQHNVASFIVPAVLKEARGSAESVELFTCALVDLDTGNTAEKYQWLTQHIGPPTMVVKSGGRTEAGTPKLHVYWVFDEPVADVRGVVDLRHEIAIKVGGDLQFGRGTPDNPYGRAHQPIRIPGSVHAKGNSARVVGLAMDDGPVVEFDVLRERARRAPASPWKIEAPSSVAGALDFGGFSPTTTYYRPDISESLTADVHEGSEDGRTRYSEFSRVAGHNIRQAREGRHTVDEARELTLGWVLQHMKPAWPEGRALREFNRLLSLDEGKHGPIRSAIADEPGVGSGARHISEWRVDRWTNLPAKPRKFLVEGLILESKPHLFVAEGGAGKTFSILDLALMVSTFEEGEDNSRLVWMGQRVLAGGPVVVLTTEDDADELHIRMEAIDPEGARFRAGSKLVVVPAVNHEGAFAFGHRDKATGDVTPSDKWRVFQEQMADIKPVLVVVDTLNTTLHGEENSATVVNEYARLLQGVCGKLKAALVVTHHIRKQDPKFPIKTPDDMAMAVRGSSALPAAFRAVIGMWACPAWGKLLPMVGERPRPKAMWNLAVVKANNPEMVPGMKYLVRQPSGRLLDVTHKIDERVGDVRAQRRAWLLAAVAAAADGGAPYWHGKKDAANGLYARRSELHEGLRDGARTGLEPLVDELVEAGELMVVRVQVRDARGRGRIYPVLDVRGGRLAADPHTVIEADTRWSAPNWSRDWRYDPAQDAVVPRGDDDEPPVFGGFAA